VKGRELSPMIQNFINTLYTKIIFGTLFFILNSTLSMGATSGKVEQHELLVIGTGPVVDENVARAREMAISEALVKGVEEYLTRRLGSQGMINNFPRLINEIIPGAREEIENFHILAEERMDGRYKILIRLKINDKVMEEKLREIGLIIMEGPPIKVLFLVSQIDSRKGKSDYWWKDPENDSGFTLTDLALHRVFQERGFHPINRLSSVPEGEYNPEMKVMDLFDEDAIKWGTLYAAKVVIHGRSEIVEGEKVSVMLKALDIEKGSLMFQDEETEKIDEASGSEEQVMQSIERAINNIATRLSPVIMSAFEGTGLEINQVEITLQGLRDFKQLKAFTDFLKKNMRGVISVIQTRVRGRAISVSVEFSGNRDRFLGMLLKHENLPFEAEVNDTEDGEIIISIR
jgi:hypothetical protein